MKLRSLLTILFASAVSLSALAGGGAKFSYFSYEGDDEYYRNNPLTAPGDYFNPVIGGWASDPSICRTGDDYWLVTSTFGYFPGVPLYHSRDLVSWQHVGNVLDRPSQLPDLPGLSIDKGGVYAPALSHNPADGKYYMITTCVMHGKSDETVNFYVTAEDPRGAWSEPVVLDSVTGIDPSFFFDDNGKAYIVYKSDEKSPVKWSNHRALSIIEFDPATGRTVGAPVKFKEEGVGPEEKLERNEGPHIYKIDGKYYLIAAEGGTGWSHSEVCYKADSVFGPYRRWSRNPMLTQRLLKPHRKLPVTCAGHADLVQTPAGDWYAVFLGCRPWNDGEDHLGRETYLMPVRWSADGFPYITQNLDTVPLRANIPSLAAPQQSQQAGNFAWRDDFTTTSMRPEWLSLWGDPKPYYTTGKGLELQYAPMDSRSGSVPAYLGRRMQHHRFTAETEVTLAPRADESAGMLMVKNEQRQIYLAVSEGKVSLLLLGKKGRSETLAEADIDTRGKTIGLRVVSEGDRYRFYYRPSGGTWTQLGEGTPAEYIASQRGGFTGSTIGLFATSLKQ